MRHLVTVLILGGILLPICSFTDANSYYKRPPKVDAYIQKYRYLASEINQKNQIPVPIIFAVAGLESDWGTSQLALSSNNHFGIKSKDWHGAVYCKPTNEFLQGQHTVIDDCFRSYHLIRDSYLDFGNFLSQSDRYQQLFFYATWDYRSWAMGLEYYQYATDPDYAEKLLRLIDEYGLWDWERL